MDKRELADQYIREVVEEYGKEVSPGSGTATTLALIRACEDLLICKDEFARYKAGIIRERQEDLARALGIPADALASYCKEETLLNDELRKPQDRTGAEQTPPRPDPHRPRVAPRHGPVSSTPEGSPPPDPTDSLVRCPNCGEWATYAKSKDDVLVYCTHCDYEEKR